MSRHKKEAIWYTLLSLSVFIFLWYAYVTFFHIPSFILPTPTAVAKEMVFQLTQMDFYKNLLYTLSEVLFGFALSVLFGIIVGYCIGKHPHIKQLSMPLLVFFQVSPKIALIPIFIIWFGLGYGSKLFIVFIMSFFPIIEGVLLGLGHIPKEMYAYMQVLNADCRQIFTQLEFPCCIPYLLSSFKISILQAIIGATVAEWMAGQLGIGYLQSFASSTFDSPLLISGILFTILLGILLYAAVNLLEQRLQRYQEVKQ